MIRTIALGAAALTLLLGGASAVGGVAMNATASLSGFVTPVTGASISLAFGCTDLTFEPVDARCPGGHWHSGVDLAAPRGSLVHATLDGVVRVFISAFGYGLHAVIDHGGGLSSLYAHLNSVCVSSGAWVAAGELIGTVGSTGNSTGPHLHFEIRRDGIAEDPRGDLRLP